MATIRQQKAVEALVGNGGNVTQAMRDAGYSENTINTPQKLTESDGFKEICDKYGLTEGLILEALVSDIKAKPKKRFLELQLGAKIKQMLIDRVEHSGSIEQEIKADEETLKVINNFIEWRKTQK